MNLRSFIAATGIALLTTIAVSFVGISVSAEEHPLGSIQGRSIDLKTYDHAFAGVINGVVAWGFVDEATFTSELRLRKYGQTLGAVFKRQEGVGTVRRLITQR